MKRGKTIIIQGGQYGSEGKGQVAAAIARERGVKHVVRTGSINAGHTVYYQQPDGSRTKAVMQTLPTAWVNGPDTMMYIGPGAYVNEDVLADEVEKIASITGRSVNCVLNSIVIDHRVHFFGEDEAKRSAKSGRHHAMGATGKGGSEAIVSKMMKRGTVKPEKVLLKHRKENRHRYNFGDVTLILQIILKDGLDVLLEGTQGALLDFNLGPWPYVTSRMCTPAAWLAEAGLPPVNVETILVLRTFPIRVAGNSGPMPDEITWPTLVREMKQKMLPEQYVSTLPTEEELVAFELALSMVIQRDWPEAFEDVGGIGITNWGLWSEEQKQKHAECVSEANRRALDELLPAVTERLLKFFEKTTVTKKLRRISRFSIKEARKAVRYCGPTSVCLAFINYSHPETMGQTESHHFYHLIKNSIEALENDLGVPITHVTTGPYLENVVRL